MIDEKTIDDFIEKNLEEKSKKEGPLDQHFINAYTIAYKEIYHEIMGETALKLHKKGLSIREIIDIVNLTEDEFFNVIAKGYHDKGYFRGIQIAFDTLKKAAKKENITEDFLERLINRVKERYPL